MEFRSTFMFNDTDSACLFLAVSDSVHTNMDSHQRLAQMFLAALKTPVRV